MNDKLELYQFLPIYPSYEKDLEEILGNEYTNTIDQANYDLYRKKEFLDLRLEQIESKPNFPGQLMKHQKAVARFLSSHTLYNNLLLVHSLGCLAPDTQVLLYDGSVKMAKDIAVNDKLIGDDGTPRTVLQLIRGNAQMYEIVQENAQNYIVNSEHILTMVFSGNSSILWNEKNKTWSLKWFDPYELKMRAFTKAIKKAGITKDEGYAIVKQYAIDNHIGDERLMDIKVSDYLNLPNYVKVNLKGIRCSGINWPSKDVLLDPYVLGMWLGDGNSRGDGFTSDDKELINYWDTWSSKNDCEVIKAIGDKYSYRVRRNGNGLVKSINDSVGELDINVERGDNGKVTNPLKQLLKHYNLIENKHIPVDYILNDRETRLKVLAGLIDTDGYVYREGRNIEIVQKNNILSENIVYLVRSLGFYCSTKKVEKSCMYKGEKIKGIYNNIYISGNGLEEIPTLLPRKKLYKRRQIKDPLVTGIKVIPLENGEYCGWSLDGNKRFLLGDFTITHNSGKTCSSVAAIEQIRSEGNTYKGALVLMKGQNLLTNYKKELIFTCTDGRYIPEDYDELTDNQKVRRIKDKLSDFYQFETFELFFKNYIRVH
jgi:hypothetical protein